jgi:hypothetical protein
MALADGGGLDATMADERQASLMEPRLIGNVASTTSDRLALRFSANEAVGKGVTAACPLNGDGYMHAC